MTDFSTPQRMSVAAFIIILVKNLRSILKLVLILFMANLFGDAFDFADPMVWIKGLYTLGIGITLAVILALAAYLPKTFHINNGNLIFSHGIISKETTTIPLEKIHTLRTRQDIIYQILKMRGIAFDTLASEGAEIELILDEADWQALSTLINHPVSSPNDLASPPPFNPAHQNESLLIFKNSDLLRDALCQNHLKGMAVLAGVLYAIFEQIDAISEETTDAIADYAAMQFDEFVNHPVLLAAALSATYVIVLVLWIGKVLLRYFNMTLSYDNKRLTFSHGLFSRSTSRFSFNKICTFWLKQNFFEKKYGLATMMLRQALNVTASKDDDNLRIYGTDSSGFFLKWWLGDGYDSSPDLLTAKSGKGVFFHSFIPALAICLAVSIALFYFGFYLWLIVPGLYLAVAVARGVCAMRRSHICLKESFAIVSNGCFSDMLNYMKYENVNVVRIRRTPFSHISHRVNLQLSTPGSSFTVRSLRKEEAGIAYEYILKKSESCRKNIF